MIYLLIAVGGAAGSVFRYLIGGVVQRTSASGFPVGTMFVNVSGCFLIGVLLRQFLNMQVSPELRAFLIVGFCGGFTTFSTFSAETLGLIEGGEYGRATGYVILSVALCLAATFAGMTAMRLIAGTGNAR
ncbi:MAG TPA: fluoride efflux transporter CrcB [Gemmatimonadaceae bacterium]|jgi:CrcB protein|nr:fluoride efflux transporter CrcB [Gemmatimonadaceae bacterium]